MQYVKEEPERRCSRIPLGPGVSADATFIREKLMREYCGSHCAKKGIDLLEKDMENSTAKYDASCNKLSTSGITEAGRKTEVECLEVPSSVWAVSRVPTPYNNEMFYL